MEMDVKTECENRDHEPAPLWPCLELYYAKALSSKTMDKMLYPTTEDQTDEKRCPRTEETHGTT
jgi:hypothetical protein